MNGSRVRRNYDTVGGRARVQFRDLSLRFWREPEDLIDRQHVDRPQVQRADAWLDHLPIADDDDGELVGVDVLCATPLHVGGGDRLMFWTYFEK